VTQPFTVAIISQIPPEAKTEIFFGLGCRILIDGQINPLYATRLLINYLQNAIFMANVINWNNYCLILILINRMLFFEIYLVKSLLRCFGYARHISQDVHEISW